MSSDRLDPQWLAGLSARLACGESINEAIADVGHLRLDRPLPFLCFYRGKANEATETLLHGQAAYLTLDKCIDPCELLRLIIAQRSAQFGGFLLIELWQGALQTARLDEVVAPEFHIYAATADADALLMERFETSLQSIKLRNRIAEVRVSFDADAHHRIASLLFTPQEQSRYHCLMMGLEVRPVYLDETGEMLPFAMQVMRRGISRALRQWQYDFSHQRTSFHPAHYHQLGVRTLTKAVEEVDRRLAGISENFDLLLHVTPVNAAQAWEAFQTSGFRQTPQFLYRPRKIDPALLKRELYHIPLERVTDPCLFELFEAKRNELDRALSLLRDRNRTTFLLGSMQMFGRVEQSLLDIARMILGLPDQPSGSDSKRLSAQLLAEHASREVAAYREMDTNFATSVSVRDDISGILVSHGNFLIGSDAHVSEKRLTATLSHEIGTHALTYHNGKSQPLQLMYAGLAGYEELQEGLAVLAEYLCDGLHIARLKLLAGRVIAVDQMINGADFCACFASLCNDYGFREYTAYNLTMRVYRGGGYTKDMIYLRGFVRLLEHLGNEREVEPLYSGKIAMDHLHLLDELRWRGVLAPIALTPRYLQDAAAQQRLQLLRQTPTIEHVIENL